MTTPPPQPQLADNHDLVAQVFRLTGDIAALKARQNEVETKVEEFAGALDELEAEWTTADLPDTPAPGRSDDAGTAAPAASDAPSDKAGQQATAEPLDMRRLVSWVRDNIALQLQRRVPQTTGTPFWCKRWWMHPEAIARLEAVRRSWLEATASPGDALVIYYEHLDHQLSVLCGEAGPFSACRGGQHAESGSKVEFLGQDEPTEDYYLEFERSQQQEISSAPEQRKEATQQ